MPEKTRNQRLLSLLSNGHMSILGLSHYFDCPEASIRRSIHELREEGYYIVVENGTARSYGKRSALIPDQSDNIGGDDDADYQR